jgi:hypothetical protein
MLWKLKIGKQHLTNLHERGNSLGVEFPVTHNELLPQRQGLFMRAGMVDQTQLIPNFILGFLWYIIQYIAHFMNEAPLVAASREDVPESLPLWRAVPSHHGDLPLPPPEPPYPRPWDRLWDRRHLHTRRDMLLRWTLLPLGVLNLPLLFHPDNGRG